MSAQLSQSSLDFPGLSDRADFALIQDRWENLRQRREALLSALEDSLSKAGNDPSQKAIEIANETRSLWFAILSLGQALRPAINDRLLTELRQHFSDARDVVAKLLPQNQDGDDALGLPSSSILHSIQARLDSLDALAASGSLAEFEAIGIVRPVAVVGAKVESPAKTRSH